MNQLRIPNNSTPQLVYIYLSDPADKMVLMNYVDQYGNTFCHRASYDWWDINYQLAKPRFQAANIHYFWGNPFDAKLVN